MTNKQTKKAKRPLQTTLGKAPGQNEKEEVDLSHVKRPIETNIYGLHQVLNLLKTATEEIQDYVTYECDIMYECRMCRTIFRSLANFILHKRNYCRVKYKASTSNCREDCLMERVHPPEPPKEKEVDKEAPTAKGLIPVIEKLKEKQEIKQLTEELLNSDLSNHKEHEEATVTMSENNVLLEAIATNKAAVFQTVPQRDVAKPECMRNEVMELHGILESDKAVLGSDGKICNFQTNKLNAKSILPKTGLSCSECNIKFSTRKTLGFHLKNKHNNSRLVYVCPDCKETYTNAWSVYRHLFKVHRKTSAQVKRLREQVYNSVIRKDQETHKKIEKKDFSNSEKADEENQWLNNIEGDNDFQMCGGCGKRFERKAALQSHAAMCIKRMAVCATIKNNKKKEEEESKDNKAKLNKLDKSPSPENPETQLKGASKRKPYLLRTYKQSSSSKVCDKIKLTHSEHNCGVQSNKDVPTEVPCDTYVNGKDSDNEKSEQNCDNGIVWDLNDNNDAKADCDCPNQKKVSEDTAELEKKIVTCSKDKDYFCSSSGEIKMLSILGMQLIKSIDQEDRIEVIKEEIISPSQQSDQSDTKSSKVSKFDRFCQKVAKQLRNIDRSDDHAEDSEKSCTAPAEETSAKIYESHSHNSSRSSLDFQSPGKISIRSLEELRGFPKESEVVDEDMPVLEPSVSPKTPKKSPRNPTRIIKRKGTLSLDSERTRKTFKPSKFDVLLDKPARKDPNFMARASPHMDRSTLTCKACQMQYPSLSKLHWHMSAHFTWYRFQCSRCSFVSFGKSECAIHAKASHEIKSNEIASVVLPIPNWKTILMSSEFKELNHEHELGGKHTDEVKPACENEPALRENNEIDPTTNIINTLFVDSESDATELNELTDVEGFPMPRENEVVSIENESIDISDDDQESFQLEVPQEMFTRDVFEIIDVDNGVEIRRPLVKEEIDDVNDDCEIPNCSSAIPVPSEEVRACDGLNKNSANNVVNVRPTRNRMRSIKTLQNDFFYDLDKANKQPDTVVKTNGPLKQKKNNGSSTVKKDKEMRVYSKK